MVFGANTNEFGGINGQIQWNIGQIQAIYQLCQSMPGTAQGQEGTRQGQTGTSRDKQGQTGTFPICPCLSLLVPASPTFLSLDRFTLCTLFAGELWGSKPNKHPFVSTGNYVRPNHHVLHILQPKKGFHTYSNSTTELSETIQPKKS